MSYARVIPRDLFNEGDLLNCLGRLWIKLDGDRRHHAELVHHDDGAFVIVQDPADGSISCLSVELTFPGADSFNKPHLFRQLNARDKWPLWLRHGDEDLRVFDLDGELSPEFWILISQPELARQRRERR